MAISKIKPIKKSLKKAIDYIINPEKTEQGKYVSSFGCSPLTADIEMQLTTNKARNKSERIAYHLMQSFSPDDDITPEKAHELGREFAERITDGKHEYVISTHIDKGHIHNHIIFNSTSFVDYKKFHMPSWHKYRMFNINDEICRRNGLSVIEHKTGKKGRSWYENKVSKEGERWKDKMKASIDSAICEATSYEEFTQIMQMEGYEYKETESVLRFRATCHGQEKFTRVNARNFGEYYSKEMLVKRINDKVFNQSIDKKSEYKEKGVKKDIGRKPSTEKKPFSSTRKVNLIVDISKNMKAKNSEGYEHVLVMNNINAMVKTLNYLQKNDMTTVDDLVENMNNIDSVLCSLEDNFKKMEVERKTLSEKIKFSQNYVKYKKTAFQARKETQGSEFINLHKDEIMLYKVAEIYMQKNNIDTSYLDIKLMIQEHKETLENGKVLKNKILEMKKKYNDIENVKVNVEQILAIKIETEKDKRQNSAKRKKEKTSEIEL